MSPPQEALVLDGESILIDAWGPLVRSAVVARVERATVGRRGVLVRVLAEPETARYAWTQWLHEVVLRAILDETGADLEEVGSQAAWAVYDETWGALADRWADGGDLAVVPRGLEEQVTTLLLGLSPDVATCLAVDTGVRPPVPLRLEGRVRVDTQGALAAIAGDVPGVDRDRSAIDRLLNWLA